MEGGGETRGAGNGCALAPGGRSCRDAGQRGAAGRPAAWTKGRISAAAPGRTLRPAPAARLRMHRVPAHGGGARPMAPILRRPGGAHARKRNTDAGSRHIPRPAFISFLLTRIPPPAPVALL